MEETKYQIDLLTALNEKLMNSERIFRHIVEYTGFLYMYFDLATPGKVDFYGPWDEKVGAKIANQPYDESYLLTLLCDEDQDLFRTKLFEMERSGIKYENINVRSRNKQYWLNCTGHVQYSWKKSLSLKTLPSIRPIPMSLNILRSMIR